MNKPQIDYPCEWSYTIIGADENALREAAKAALGLKAFTVTVSNKSRSGKYTSLIITTNVLSEEERNSICKNLSAHPAVKIVI